MPTLIGSTKRTFWSWGLLATLGLHPLAGFAPAPAEAQSFDGERTAFAVPHGPGPEIYDCVFVRKYGPRDAKHVLVLNAGSPSGQGNYTSLAPELVARVPGLQVWTIDPVEPDDAPFVREWGLNVPIRDVRAVVLAARDGGRRGVILGGHSMGSIFTPVYAAWDFDGEPGHRDLEAMVLIDGVGFRAFSSFVAGTPFAKRTVETVRQVCLRVRRTT
ncbi:MAG TPA: hypothetical protein VFD92_20700 [Candidatus Binatia bacterium]|nr:hypothetical protein [Candidatus Binatia bacterium]